MYIEIGHFGEHVPMYDTLKEERTAILNYLSGNYGALTCDEVAFLRDCQEDPTNERWERLHAGEIIDISKTEMSLLLFHSPLAAKSEEECMSILRKTVGPHPITIITLKKALKTYEHQFQHEHK